MQIQSIGGPCFVQRRGVRYPRPNRSPSVPKDDSPAAILGDRIRGLRKRRGLTLANLAAKSCLSPGYISQIERDLAQPSIPAVLEYIGTPSTTAAGTAHQTSLPMKEAMKSSGT